MNRVSIVTLTLDKGLTFTLVISTCQQSRDESTQISTLRGILLESETHHESMGDPCHSFNRKVRVERWSGAVQVPRKTKASLLSTIAGTRATLRTS
jgi:hypothetical protein